MARPLRIEYPGAVYHITSRGNEKKSIFKDDQERYTFLDILETVNKRYHWMCHAYCLMDNHYHLLIETPDGNLSIGMRYLNGVYTQFFNRQHKRTGHLFQGRYKAILIQKDSHLLAVCRYVVLNPIRGGIVARPEEWKWSSYRATAGRAKRHSCLTTDWVLGQFSVARGTAEKEYRQFVRGGIGKEPIWTEVKGQVILGEDEFICGFVDYIKKHNDISDIPKSQRYVSRPGLDKLFTEPIRQNRKDRDRKIAEAVEEHGYTQGEVADYLGLHFSSVSRIMRNKVRC
jgi:REP element-mobilizing transposase RayT